MADSSVSGLGWKARLTYDDLAENSDGKSLPEPGRYFDRVESFANTNDAPYAHDKVR